jgi:hypothetical protein
VKNSIGCVLAFLTWAAMSSPSTLARQAPGAGGRELRLDIIAPELHARLVALERAQGVLFDALVASNGKVNEADLLKRLTRQVSGPAAEPQPGRKADRGADALGPRGAEVVRRAYAFHREVVGIYARRSPADRRSALDAAIRRYRSEANLALPDTPKDMSILYDHAYTSFVPPTPPEAEPRRELAYPALTGFLWAARWYELAVLVPLEQFDAGAERDRGLATVAGRFQRKLSSGTPPDSFPTELPLAPAIAPGLVLTHDRAASIVDNLNMMLDVLTDVLVHPAVTDRRAAVDEVIAQFTDRQYRCVQTDEWIVVALRHGIFAQGGHALATMTTWERNAFSGNHGQHFGARRAPPPCDPE